MNDKGLHGHSKVIEPQLNMSSSAKCGLNKQFNKSYMIIFANIYTVIGLLLTIFFPKKFQSKSSVDVDKILNKKCIMYNRKY